MVGAHPSRETAVSKTARPFKPMGGTAGLLPQRSYYRCRHHSASQIDQLFTVCVAQSDSSDWKPVTQCHWQECIHRAHFSGWKYLMKAWECASVIKGAPSDLYSTGLDNF